MISVACAIIKNDSNRILLVQRSATMSHPLQWEFPGGKLAGNESPRQAIEREIAEELGIKVKALSELPQVFWEYPDKKIGLVPVICEIRSGEIHLHEHLEARWLRYEELGKMNVLEADRLIIKQLEGTT